MQCLTKGIRRKRGAVTHGVFLIPGTGKGHALAPRGRRDTDVTCKRRCVRGEELVGRERRALAVLAIVTALYGFVISLRPDWRYNSCLDIYRPIHRPIGLSLRMALSQLYGAVRGGEIPRSTARNRASGPYRLRSPVTSPIRGGFEQRGLFSEFRGRDDRWGEPSVIPVRLQRPHFAASLMPVEEAGNVVLAAT